MLYEAAETDDNPLISFIKEKSGWTVRSPWQNKECDEFFTREELELAIVNLAEELSSLYK